MYHYLLISHFGRKEWFTRKNKCLLMCMYKTMRKIHGFLYCLYILSSFYLKYLFLVKFLIPRYSNANLNLQQLINKSKAALLLLGLLSLLRCILFNRRYWSEVLVIKSQACKLKSNCPEATWRLPGGCPEAARRLPEGYPEANQGLPIG